MVGRIIIIQLAILQVSARRTQSSLRVEIGISITVRLSLHANLTKCTHQLSRYSGTMSSWLGPCDNLHLVHEGPLQRNRSGLPLPRRTNYRDLLLSLVRGLQALLPHT